MKELSQLHCSPVTADIPHLNDRDVNQLIAELPGWKTYEKDGELRLEKSFQFGNFNQAIAFTDQVAGMAVEEDHHPALLTEWGKVTGTWWTHKIKSLHRNDFIMAAKTEQLYAPL